MVRAEQDLTVPAHAEDMTGVLRQKRGRGKEIDSKLNELFANVKQLVQKSPGPARLDHNCSRS
jgi:hypothetical protein